MQSLIKFIFIMKMNVLHMVRNRVGTIKIMLNRRNNEVTNVKIRKKRMFGAKNKNWHVFTRANKPGISNRFYINRIYFRLFYKKRSQSSLLLRSQYPKNF